jgi:hypothetical protein
MWIGNTKKNLDIKNTVNRSALDVAAFFCNHEVANLFVRMKLERTKKQLLSAGKRDKIRKNINTLLEYALNGNINKHIQNYVSYPWINMNVCGNIRINDTFDLDQISNVLKMLQSRNTV